MIRRFGSWLGWAVVGAVYVVVGVVGMTIQRVKKWTKKR